MLSTYRASQRRPHPRPRTAKWLVLVALFTVLCACEKSSHDQLLEARTSLASASYADAIATAEAGLQASPSKADAWGLELIKLEAYARGGNGDRAKQQLEKLAGLYPKQLTSTDYSTTAQQLQTAEQGPDAIQVLDLGKKRYPSDALIERMLADAVSEDSSPAELEMLRSLGYIE